MSITLRFPGGQATTSLGTYTTAPDGTLTVEDEHVAALLEQQGYVRENQPAAEPAATTAGAQPAPAPTGVESAPGASPPGTDQPTPQYQGTPPPAQGALPSDQGAVLPQGQPAPVAPTPDQTAASGPLPDQTGAAPQASPTPDQAAPAPAAGPAPDQSVVTSALLAPDQAVPGQEQQAGQEPAPFVAPGDQAGG